MVKTVTLAFCRIQLHFIRDIHPKFGILHFPQSLDIAKHFDGGFSNFRISIESLIKRNCHNSRTSDDIDIKLGSATKLDKKKERKSRKFDNDFMLEIVKSLSFF